MRITILSCGIFQPELDIIIPEIKQELKDYDIEAAYLSAGLHNTPEIMKEELVRNLDALKSEKIVALYGSGCHAELPAIVQNYNAVYPAEKNCIEVMLSPEVKAELDKAGNIIYLTAGWLKSWQEMSLQKGTFAADKVIYLDCAANLVSDEEILEYYDFVNMPIEPHTITLNTLKDVVIALCKKLLD